MSKKLLDFKYVGETKFNPEDGKWYTLHFSTRFPPPMKKDKRAPKNNNNQKFKNGN